MKICHLMSGDLWAGAEVQVFETVRELHKRGIDILVIAYNEARFAKELRTAGVRVEVIDERQHNFISMVRKTRAAVGRFNPDIVHAHRYKENLMAVLCGGRAKRVQTVHGLPEPFKGYAALRMHVYQFINRLVRSAFFARIITVSDDIAARLYGQARPNNVVTVHNAIDLSRYTPFAEPALPRTTLGVHSSKPIAGTVARLVPIKDLDNFLRTAKLLKEEALFVIAGDGPEEKRLQRLAAELGLESAVRFLGYRNDVIEVIKHFDIFLNSSRHEGVPVSVLEAMALGKPVAATAVGGVPEVIEDGVSGVLVKPMDPEALADATRKLLKDSGLRLKLGAAARKRIESKFSISAQADSLIGIYRDTIN